MNVFTDLVYWKIYLFRKIYYDQDFCSNAKSFNFILQFCNFIVSFIDRVYDLTSPLSDLQLNSKLSNLSAVAIF